MVTSDGAAGSEHFEQPGTPPLRDFSASDVRKALELEKVLSTMLSQSMGNSLTPNNQGLVACEVSQRRIMALTGLYDEMLRGI